MRFDRLSLTWEGRPGTGTRGTVLYGLLVGLLCAPSYVSPAPAWEEHMRPKGSLFVSKWVEAQAQSSYENGPQGRTDTRASLRVFCGENGLRSGVKLSGEIPADLKDQLWIQETEDRWTSLENRGWLRHQSSDKVDGIWETVTPGYIFAAVRKGGPVKLATGVFSSRTRACRKEDPQNERFTRTVRVKNEDGTKKQPEKREEEPAAATFSETAEPWHRFTTYRSIEYCRETYFLTFEFETRQVAKAIQKRCSKWHREYD